ncbi:MAG TPA: nucleotidyltransferase family protein [Candidatus Nanoperiomorbaceae bacterium]|nr:nucleotidyltransferase family protein [Candidatus Nanoperiomorbaceae bacterium]
MKIKQSMIEIRPEDELLFCCARTKTSEEVGDRIKVLIRKNLDWHYLMKSAFHHKVVPLLYQNLRRISPGPIPEQCLNELQKYYELNTKRNLFLAVELIKLLRLLEAKKIFAIPYKGPVIAVLAYRNISLRQFSDLDILVHPNDYLKTMHFFLEKGYRLKAEYSWECSLIDASHGVCVDLHRGITPEQFPVFLDFQAMKQRLMILKIGAGETMTFCPEDMLVILCIQLAKDGWGHRYNPIRLSKLCDLSELIQAHPDINWKRVFKDTKKIGCWKMLLVSLSLVHVIFGTPIPKLPPRSLKYLGDLNDDIYNKLMHQSSVNNVELLSMEKFHFKIRERWRDKLYPYYSNFRQRLIPNERDRALISLPESLDVIYYAIRPIRLMIDYGQLALKIVKEKFFTWKRQC